MTIFDSSGIEAFVTENNPKYANRIIRQLKAYAKSLGKDSSFDPYKAAYASMPSHESSNPEIKQLYINGHFCYVFKFGIVTNGLGIIRHISFYNKDFMDAHPDIIVDKKSDSPDEDKTAHDSKLLIPTLKDFFEKHPLIDPKLFLGDAAFDSVFIYEQLLSGDTFGENRHFQQAYIPLNERSKLKNPDFTINEYGIPCCPHDPSLPMKTEGNAMKSHGSIRYKFVCPKMKWLTDKETGKNHRYCYCENPCTASSCGRMIYIRQDNNYRVYPGTIRGTKEWDDTYKIRTVVEQDINHIKENLCSVDTVLCRNLDPSVINYNICTQSGKCLYMLIDRTDTKVTSTGIIYACFSKSTKLSSDQIIRSSHLSDQICRTASLFNIRSVYLNYVLLQHPDLNTHALENLQRNTNIKNRRNILKDNLFFNQQAGKNNSYSCIFSTADLNITIQRLPTVDNDFFHAKSPF